MEEIEGVSAQAAPFFDLVGTMAFGESGIPAVNVPCVKQLMVEIIDQVQGTINIVNFWNNAPEVARLRGELSDLMLATGIDEIIQHTDELVTEITQLAKVRHQDLIR